MVTVPVMPLMLELSMVTMLRIEPTPSASYFAPGSVMTSIFFIMLAGMALSTSLALPESVGSGWPFLYILKLLLPLTMILSWPSTVTRGTLRSISRAVLVLASSSFCTL